MIKEDIFDTEHLNIAFHRLQPEILLQNIRVDCDIMPKPSYMKVRNSDWGEKTYIHYALAQEEPNRTDDEARYMSKHFSQRIAHNTRGNSVFEMLQRYARELLTTDGVQPLCRYEYILRWRKLTLTLGQDLFTTAYFAEQDAALRYRRRNFIWPATVSTDNKRMSQLLTQGISENHFHLTGSTRMLSLAWACMMNHPKRIHSFFHDKTVREAFAERLNPTVSGNPEEHPMSWEELILYAAHLRASLFTRCIGLRDAHKVKDEFKDFDKSMQWQTARLGDMIGALRYNYGAVISQQNGRGKVLDYALTPDLEGCYESHNRVLAGERHFLYLCFKNCFTDEFTDMEKDLFYLYLLIQNQFRGEMIQVNDRIGFQNFSRYQDRKETSWGGVPEYWDESIRLAVNATLENGSIHSLEARVCPAKKPGPQKDWIMEMDRAYGFAQTGKALNASQIDMIADSPLFYVLHFPKNRKEIYQVNSDASKLSAMAYPRNSGARRDSEMQARSMAIALKNSAYLRKRIRGIDACSNEVGCRPETFATEFRYLRSRMLCKNSDVLQQQADSEVHLAATYHAGEDFVDIIDGLRAIDEAVRFLELRRGDRLGHALALGVKPSEYYHLKNNKLAIPRQELLDNLVWFLFRTQSYDIPIPGDLQTNLESEARRLMTLIGYDSNKYSLLAYYQSWHLRGDHPRIYKEQLRCADYFKCNDWTDCDTCSKRKNPEDAQPFWHIIQGNYENFYSQTAPELANYRNDGSVRALCWLYHYDYGIKENGKLIAAYQVEPKIVPIVEELQNKMQHDLMESGISIECNPSSNVLIGSFSQYRDHPLFRFNRHRLYVPQWENETPANLCVSINTDDQGVFDTSLENEYALVARALECERDENGRRMNSNDEIYDYLNHIRILGNSQTFHYKGNEMFGKYDYKAYCADLREAGSQLDAKQL